MALDNLYEQELASAGPRARGPLKRSYYLQRALDEIGKGPKNLTPASTVTNLLAEALLQYGRNRQDKKAEEAGAADRADEAKRASDFFGSFGGEAPPPPMAAPQAPIPPMQPQASTNLAPSMDMGAVAKSRDLLARLVSGESATDPGQQAAASVIFNRARQSGLTPDQVATAKGQFEPYGNKATWARLQNLDPQSMARALSNVDAASQSPTTNADHFFGPQAQAVLGRQPPAWGQGPGQMIGGNKFMQQGYQAPTQPGAIQPPISTPSAMMSQPAGPQGVDNTGTPPPQMPPQAPQQPTGGQARGLAGVTPQEQQLIMQGLQSNDPTMHAWARKRLMEVQFQSTQPPDYEQHFDPQTGQTVYAPKGAPGPSSVVQAPGQWGSQILSAEQNDPRLPKGAVMQRSRTGEIGTVYQPPLQQGGLSGQGSPAAGAGQVGGQQGTAPRPGPDGRMMLGGRPAPGYEGMRFQQGPDGTLKPVVEPTPEQRKVSRFTQMMTQANDLLNQLAQKGIYKPSNILTSMVLSGNVQEAALSPEDRNYLNAARMLTAARLRWESGAAIPPSEVANTMRDYMGIATDDPRTLAQKARVRGGMLRGFQNEGGIYYTDMYGVDGPNGRTNPPVQAFTDPTGVAALNGQQSAAPRPTATDPKTGHKVYWDGHAWKPVQ